MTKAELLAKHGSPEAALDAALSLYTEAKTGWDKVISVKESLETDVKRLRDAKKELEAKHEPFAELKPEDLELLQGKATQADVLAAVTAELFGTLPTTKKDLKEYLQALPEKAKGLKALEVENSDLKREKALGSFTEEMKWNKALVQRLAKQDGWIPATVEVEKDGQKVKGWQVTDKEGKSYEAQAFAQAQYPDLLEVLTSAGQQQQEQKASGAGWVPQNPPSGGGKPSLTDSYMNTLKEQKKAKQAQ